MNTHNLNRLIALLESLPDEKVDLDHWRSDGNYFDDNISDDQLVNDCGTCGCIVGWLPVLTGVPVDHYRRNQLADFLSIGNDLAYDIAHYNFNDTEIGLPDRIVALNRLKELLK
jgi:hypothetical protein